MSEKTQFSFTKGEISPSLYGRPDTVGYATGARTLKNMMVQQHGGVQNRPGTVYLSETKDSSKTARLFPFVFSDDQTYALEFGDGYIRFFQDGAAVGPGTVTAWSAVTAYVAGDLVSYLGTNYVALADHTNEFPGTPDFWYAMPADLIEIPTPYAFADLDGLKYVQSADVMTFVHPGYAVAELKRLSAVNWTFSKKTFSPLTLAPSDVINDGSAAEAAIEGNAISSGVPAVIATVNPHGFSDGDIVTLEAYYFRFPSENYLFSGTFVISVTGSNTFEIYNTDGTSAFPNSSGFTLFPSFQITRIATSTSNLFKTSYVVTSIDPITREESLASLPTGTSDTPSGSKVITISWSAAVGIKEYNIFKRIGLVYGFIGSTDTLSFYDNGISPDLSFNPPEIEDNSFLSDDEFPSAVGYYQQRLMLGAPSSNIEKAFASRTGNFKNFTHRETTQADDALSFVVAGEKVSGVKHFIDIGKLLVMTQSGEHIVQGNSAGALTPFEINARQYTQYGCSNAKPIVIGSTIIFVQARGKRVRELAFGITDTQTVGNDLTIYSAHLTRFQNIKEMAFQQNPNSIIWFVTDEGQLLGMTYVKEENIIGWHRHETDGFIESVVCIPEGDEDALYAIFKRTIDGEIVRYIERFTNRNEADVVDFIFMDSALTYDGRNIGSTTMTLSGGTTWDNTETLTLTASAAFFTAGDVGNAIHFTGADGLPVRCEITFYTSPTVVSVKAHRTVPVELRNTATTTWARAVDVVTGLDHLEGKTVSVLGDGFVLASPNNPQFNTPKVVTGGSITLSTPEQPQRYAVIHVGLPVTADTETLDLIDPAGNQVTRGKLINKAAIRFERSRGAYVANSLPEGNSVVGMERMKIRQNESMESPTDLLTDEKEIVIAASWNKVGRLAIRVVDPLPVSVQNITSVGHNAV